MICVSNLRGLCLRASLNSWLQPSQTTDYHWSFKAT